MSSTALCVASTLKRYYNVRSVDSAFEAHQVIPEQDALTSKPNSLLVFENQCRRFTPLGLHEPRLCKRKNATFQPLG